MGTEVLPEKHSLAEQFTPENFPKTLEEWKSILEECKVMTVIMNGIEVRSASQNDRDQMLKLLSEKSLRHISWESGIYSWKIWSLAFADVEGEAEEYIKVQGEGDLEYSICFDRERNCFVFRKVLSVDDADSFIDEAAEQNIRLGRTPYGDIPLEVLKKFHDEVNLFNEHIQWHPIPVDVKKRILDILHK